MAPPPSVPVNNTVAPADPAYVLPAVIFEFLGSVNWTGKSERRAECLYFNLSA
jgi:hypothetical protein